MLCVPAYYNPQCMELIIIDLEESKNSKRVGLDVQNLHDRENLIAKFFEFKHVSFLLKIILEK